MKFMMKFLILFLLFILSITTYAKAQVDALVIELKSGKLEKIAMEQIKNRVESGVYYYALLFNNEVQSRKIIVLKNPRK